MDHSKCMVGEIKEEITHMWTDNEICEPSVIVLGIFGQCSSLTDIELHETVLHPLLEEWGRTPDHILLPTDSTIACSIQDWAESLHIKTQLFYSDWTRNGKIAQVLRNDRMIKECTHALIFLTSRTKRLEAFSEKWARKGKSVFTWDSEQHLVQIQIETDLLMASKHDHKSNKGTMLTWLKCQKKE